MARVPTWTELRLDATKLAQLQRDCYRSVHDLLDIAIPELDRKLLILSGFQRKEPQIEFVSAKHYDPVLTIHGGQDGDHLEHHHHQQKEPQIEFVSAKHYDPVLTIHDDHDDHHLDHHRRDEHDEPSMPELERKLSALNTHSNHNYHNRKRQQPEPIQKQHKRKQNLKKSLSRTNGFQKKVELPRKLSKSDLEELEHLKPLPMPLSEYLKRNRPWIVSRADQRVMYLKRMAEKRKRIASTRFTNSLERMRMFSRNNNNHKSSIRSSVRSISRENVAPDYQVKYKLSEQEMKRLTAKIYKRLPEVKKQRSNEVTKHMRLQNYKNKLEYGRKLLENRRQGIINYPLRSNYDDSSINSSQDDSFTNSYDRPARFIL